MFLAVEARGLPESCPALASSRFMLGSEAFNNTIHSCKHTTVTVVVSDTYNWHTHLDVMVRLLPFPWIMAEAASKIGSNHNRSHRRFTCKDKTSQH